VLRGENDKLRYCWNDGNDGSEIGHSPLLYMSLRGAGRRGNLIQKIGAALPSVCLCEERSDVAISSFVSLRTKRCNLIEKLETIHNISTKQP